MNDVTPMAISGYLGVLIALIIFYPFALVGINIAIFAERKRARVTKRFNLICLGIAAVVFVLHMQTEVFFGKEILEEYYRNNPDNL
ncbi:hypothetical protein [Vibrio sonorensis]|uniref:hypothetical protein n=1 Tax=Vibrio sonorensis TaxID=1004316 RepID=UPI0008DB1ED7|nr:hypothetical protein [Vibrio sonorensis]